MYVGGVNEERFYLPPARDYSANGGIKLKAESPTPVAET
jgi:hypothetical protein